MTLFQLLLYLLLLFSFGFVDAVLIVKLQESGQQSDSHLQLNKEWKFRDPITSVTLCARFSFSTLWTTNCFLQLDHEHDTEDKENHQPISAVLDLESIWFSVGGFRTRHTFPSRFVAYTWYHVCATYSHKYKVITSYLNGQEQQRFKGELHFPINGTRFKVGSCSEQKSFHGELTQVNLWNRVLSSKTISQLSKCTSNDQGNIVPWNTSWKDVGEVSRRELQTEALCENTNGPNFFLFPPTSVKQSYTSCKSITGLLPTPQSQQEYAMYKKKVTESPYLSTIDCDSYWVGASDSEQEDKWIKRNGEVVSMYWGKRQPNGQETQNCAVMKFGEHQGVYDTYCTIAACTVCVLPERPIWSLMGSCEKYKRNRHFAAIQDSEGQIVFNGYSDYQIIQDTEGKWIWKDHRANQTIATLAPVERTFETEYPFGRKLWNLSQPVCNQPTGEIMTVLLTPCYANQFTCNDASCIPLWKRCDLKPDCEDLSDEQGCRLIDIPLSYRADIPPLSAAQNTPLPITLEVILESIDIHTADMRMHVNINLTMTWKDSRVQYRNLNQDRTLNRVKYEKMHEMWVPVVDFTNTRGNRITKADIQATMAVNMQSKPTIGGYSQPEEVEFYEGAENSISIIRKYSETFQCHFDLSKYPFDEQICRMELTMLSASARSLRFGNKSSAKFIGNTQLVEYTVEGVGVHINNTNDFSVLFVEVGLVRRAGFILMNVYVPSLCLLVITYLTLYFKPTIFQVRVLATLTSLLVMTTLFTQASSHLPKTSYFKSVDVWLLTSLLIIFTVIVCHIIIDRSIDDSPNRPFKSSIVMLSKKKMGLPLPVIAPMSEGGAFVSPSRKDDQITPTLSNDSTLDRPSEVPLSRYLIVASRIIVLLGIVIFNIGYWTAALTRQTSR